MDTVRVVHFVNQFFGGLGGEERALTAVQVQAGPVGSARALQHADRRPFAVAEVLAHHAPREEGDVGVLALDGLVGPALAFRGE